MGALWQVLAPEGPESLSSWWRMPDVDQDDHVETLGVANQQAQWQDTQLLASLCHK